MEKVTGLVIGLLVQVVDGPTGPILLDTDFYSRAVIAGGRMELTINLTCPPTDCGRYVFVQVEGMHECMQPRIGSVTLNGQPTGYAVTDRIVEERRIWKLKPIPQAPTEADVVINFERRCEIVDYRRRGIPPVNESRQPISMKTK